MERRVKFMGKYYGNFYFFCVDRGRTRARVYTAKNENGIKIIGYPMAAGLTTVEINIPRPTIEDIKSILEMHPVELIAKYRPKIKIILPLPRLKNYKKLYTFGENLFAVYEYADGYIIVYNNVYLLGLGPAPPFNDDVFDMMTIIFRTKEIPSIDIVHAIDDVGEVILFYDAL